MDAHATCLAIQKKIQELLKPGELPSRIFEQIYDEIIVPESFESNFMGFGGNQVRFLGHGIGLVIDEFPALSKKDRLSAQRKYGNSCGAEKRD